MRLERKLDLLKFMLESALGTERVRTIPPMVLIEALNTAQDEIVARLAKVDSSYGVVTAQLSPAGEPWLLLPERATTILDLRYEGDNDFPGSRIEVGDFRYRTRAGDKVYPMGKRIEFEGPTTGTFTLYYRGSPWPMFLTVMGQVNTTTFTVNTTALIGEVIAVPNYYIGGVVRCSDETTEEYQRCLVTDYDYVASTLTMTVSPALWTNPTGTGHTWHVELESEVPESLHGKLVDLAFARLTGDLKSIPEIMRAVTGDGVRKLQMPGMPREIGT